MAEPIRVHAPREITAGPILLDVEHIPMIDAFAGVVDVERGRRAIATETAAEPTSSPE
jgi:hypothetical protein